MRLFQLNKSFFLVSIATLLPLTFFNSAFAADTEELVRVQGDMIRELRQELKQLKQELSAFKQDMRNIDKKQTKPITGIAANHADSGITVSSKGGINVATNDGQFKADLGGRLLYDTTSYDKDRSNLGDGTEFRAARLFLSGTVFEDWHFKGQYDFADDKLSAKDVFINYTGLKSLSLKAGQYKPPFSME